MGHTLVTIKIQNAFDWAAAQDAKGRKARHIRTAIIPDALVETGTTYLCLPSRYIKELGLRPLPRTVRATTAVGVVERQVYSGALLTIEDRTDEFSVLEVPDEAPALVGVVPLEVLDYMVDPTTQSLIGKHGATSMVLMY